jgi:Flp pilus assembly CpaE family ATPase
VGVTTPGDEAGERRMRQLGVGMVVRADADIGELADAVSGGRAPTDAAQPDPGRRYAPSAWSESAPSEPTPTATTPSPPPGASHDDRGREPEPRPQALEGVDEWAEEPGEPGRIVTVWGTDGAPGRTTVAVSLAAELAAAGRPTVLVDADTHGACIGQVLALLDEAPGIAAACRASELGTLDLPALSRLAPWVGSSLRVLTGIPSPHRWPEVRSAALEHILDLCRRLAAHVVVDVGASIEDDEELSYDTLAPRRNAAALTSLEHSGDLIVVGAADPIGLQRLVRAVQSIGTVPSPEPRVVVNKVRSSAVGSRPEARIGEVLQRFAGLENPYFVPFDPEALDGALLRGRTLVEHAPATSVRAALRRVAEGLLPEDAGASRVRRVRTGRRARLQR